MVFDAQLASIKGFKVASATALRLEVLPLAQRYAALTASLLVLSAEYEVCTGPPLRSIRSYSVFVNLFGCAVAQSKT